MCYLATHCMPQCMSYTGCHTLYATMHARYYMPHPTCLILHDTIHATLHATHCMPHNTSDTTPRTLHITHSIPHTAFHTLHAANYTPHATHCMPQTTRHTLSQTSAQLMEQWRSARTYSCLTLINYPFVASLNTLR